MRLTVTAVTYPDHSEHTNQDAVIAKKSKTTDGRDAFFAVMCDGMGNHGQSAAASIAAAFNSWFQAFLEQKSADVSQTAIFKVWDAIVNRMSKRLFNELNDPDSAATMAVFLIVDDIWYMMDVGDVRVYQITKDGVKQLSTDHTYAEREISLGHMDPMEAMADPMAFHVLQTIGNTKNIIASKASGSIGEDSVFLACTDGFYRHNRKSAIYRTFRPDSLDEGRESDALSETEENALNNGETDDMSAVVIRIFKEKREDEARTGGECA